MPSLRIFYVMLLLLVAVELKELGWYEELVAELTPTSAMGVWLIYDYRMSSVFLTDLIASLPWFWSLITAPIGGNSPGGFF